MGIVRSTRVPPRRRTCPMGIFAKDKPEAAASRMPERSDGDTAFFGGQTCRQGESHRQRQPDRDGQARGRGRPGRRVRRRPAGRAERRRSGPSRSP
ncbi:MAG: hypothetical protein MZV70_28890 [Desulfobacterales bacterium]|nr:hypothetical protein [Desulfobacterales bacterium]